ncbi:MAG: hypothetical protein HOW73_11025 [Polyangiaceae bacterium]|nr:hypothetical protein [Polyangiaceae bacterium]
MALRSLAGQKSYWHLLERRRVPTRYEVTTSKLHYYTAHGLSVATPVAAWYDRHQSKSPLVVDDWEHFADPTETTYTSYTESRSERERHVDHVLEAAGSRDASLSEAWAVALDRALVTLRYPRHGLMMAAAYAGSMAPSGRLTVALAFQSADETRHVHRLAERLTALRDARAAHRDGEGRDARRDWLEDPPWQPLRRVVEELLVAYDWGECLVALNVVLKPAIDALVLPVLASRAEREADVVTAQMLASLDKDAAWHRAWTKAFVDTALARRADNRETLERWVDRWTPRVAEAADGVARALDLDGTPAHTSRDAFAAACGLRG